MTLSILIVNWNSKDYLRRCLHSIASTCASLSPQIVVVDGGSFDGCAEMLGAEFPRVTFIQSPDNIGFGRSNNLGFEKITGEAVLLLNPDTELQQGAVAALLREISHLPVAGILGARLLNSDGSLQTSCVQSLPTPLNQALASEFLRRLIPRSSLWGIRGVFTAADPVAVEAVSGACMLLRSETFRALGGFSPEYFMYGEDMDLCAKARRLGLKIYHIPAARITHHSGASTVGTFSETSVVVMRESVCIFIRKNQGAAAAFTYRLFMAASSLLRMLLLAAPCAIAGAVCGAAAARGRHCLSFRKWTAILRWSAGTGRAPARSV